MFNSSIDKGNGSYIEWFHCGSVHHGSDSIFLNILYIDSKKNGIISESRREPSEGL